MPSITQQISYFRACYEADNRNVQLRSFFSKKVSQPKILSDIDLLTGRLPYLPVAADWGAESHHMLSLYAKEKQLYVGAFFVLGKTKVLNKQQKLIAPLLLYPAQLVTENRDESAPTTLFPHSNPVIQMAHYVFLTDRSPILNLAALLPLTPRDPSINVLEALSKHSPKDLLSFEAVMLLQEALDEIFVNLDSSALAHFPSVEVTASVERICRSRKAFQAEQFQILNTAGLCILDKGKAGRGILNELHELAATSQFSKPVKSIFAGQSHKINVPSIKNTYVPVTLNLAQEKLIKTSYESTLNVAVGPPGTGKSFTVAALATDAISRGQSVLIASQNYQAVDVIAKKLAKDFEIVQSVVKTTDPKWKKQAKERLENILNGIGTKAVSMKYVNKMAYKVQSCIAEIRRLEQIITRRIEKETFWGQGELGLLSGFWKRFKFKRLDKYIDLLPALWNVYQELEKELYAKRAHIRNYIRASQDHHLYMVLKLKRKELQGFLKALRARTGSLKEERFRKVNFDTLFQALPIWLVTMEEVHQVLPLRKDLFDLVIFDEATQCNLASAIPLLQRAKRAVIVGDPKQLRHISFLSANRQKQLLQEHGIAPTELERLNYRNKSLLDFVLAEIDSQDNIHFLNEHFRSRPDLIAFSNATFYDGQLNLMTDTPTAIKTGNLVLHPVAGKREEKGHNPVEAAQVLQLILSIAQQEEQLAEQHCQSIGILSPFRAHCDYLRELISTEIAFNTFKRHQITVGTPHFFQGEERDTMILSFALDDDAHPSAFRYLEKRDVFNVSITRAKVQQHVFISFDPNQLNTHSLLKQYIGSIQSNYSATTDPNVHPTEDEFMEEVLAVLATYHPQKLFKNYHIAGLDVDIVIVFNDKTYCIDLLGYPGEYAEAFPLERIRIFNRMDVQVFSLPFSMWTLNRKQCIRGLRKFLEI
ncbi:MAG: AAA domain-containing protein [Bacteroidota bacterium]